MTTFLLGSASALAQPVWSGGGGDITLTLPKDWRGAATSGARTEYEATRYTNSANRWARCGAAEMAVPNIRKRTQDDLNREIESMQSPLLREYAERGVRLDTSYAVVQGIRFKVTRFNDDGGLMEFRQGAAITGDTAYMLHLECDIANPPAAQDKAEAAAFFDSLKVNQP